MSRFELLVFDWDGTLMDSAGRIVACLRSAIADLNWPQRSDQQLRNIIGLSLSDGCYQLFPELGREVAPLFVRAYREHYFSSLLESEQPFPEAAQVLQTLQQHGYRLAVSTGKGRRGLDMTLESSGLGRYFETTLCAEESAPKPDPQMLYDLETLLQVPRSRMLMIGESEYDLRMARNAQVAAVGVVHGVHERQRLELCQPLACLELAQLPDWLAQHTPAC